MAMLVSYRPLAHNHSRRVLLDVPRDKTQTLRPRRRGNLLGRRCGRQAHLFHMSSSLLSHQIKGGIERLVSIVDAERPPDTPPGLRLLDFDYSSQSGFEVLRGALGAGGEVVIAVSALDIPADDPRQLLGLEERWRKAGCRIIWVLPPNNRTFFINGAYASLDQTAVNRVNTTAFSY